MIGDSPTSPPLSWPPPQQGHDRAAGESVSTFLAHPAACPLFACFFIWATTGRPGNGEHIFLAHPAACPSSSSPILAGFMVVSWSGLHRPGAIKGLRARCPSNLPPRRLMFFRVPPSPLARFIMMQDGGRMALSSATTTLSLGPSCGPNPRLVMGTHLRGWGLALASPTLDLLRVLSF